MSASTHIDAASPQAAALFTNSVGTEQYTPHYHTVPHTFVTHLLWTKTLRGTLPCPQTDKWNSADNANNIAASGRRPQATAEWAVQQTTAQRMETA